MKRSKFFHFVESMAEEVKESIRSMYDDEPQLNEDSIQENGRFYAPEIVPTLIEIFAKLPLTSSILNTSFELPVDEHPTMMAIYLEEGNDFVWMNGLKLV